MGGKQKSVGERKKINRFHIALLICIVALAGLYLFETSTVVKDLFTLEEEKRYMREIQDKNEQLEVRSSEVKSLHNLAALSSSLDLEEVGHISYIEVRAASPLVMGN
jgi:hypothetical protein